MSNSKSVFNKFAAYLTAFVLLFGCFAVNAYAEDESTVKGYVKISFEDFGVRLEEDSCAIGEPLGIIIESTEVEFYEGESVADVTLRLLDKIGIEYNVLETYLKSINNFTVNGTKYNELGEGTEGYMSGWLFTFNNKFADRGMNELYIEDGDIIEWKYSCQWGSDIGGDWNNTSAEITGISVASKYGKLSPEFNTETEEYTLTLFNDIESIKIGVELENYNSSVVYSVGDTEYKYLRDIPVKNLMNIHIKSVYTSYEGDIIDEDSITVTVNVPVIVNDDNVNDTDIPSTGDNTYIPFFAIICIASVTVVLVAGKKSRSKY